MKYGECPRPTEHTGTLQRADRSDDCLRGLANGDPRRKETFSEVSRSLLIKTHYKNTFLI